MKERWLLLGIAGTMFFLMSGFGGQSMMGAVEGQKVQPVEVNRPVASNKEKTPEDRLMGLSIACSEPASKKAYLETARSIVGIWLDSLKDEKGKYQLSDYEFIDDLSENRVFLGDGYVNGGREFVCYVAFRTNIEEEDSAFYASGTYDTFYHYYFGPGVLARFRWENGKCILTDYDEAFALLTNDRLTEGLYGIKQSEMNYKTFFDFMNDRENIKKWLSIPVETQYFSKLCMNRCSHNVTMLANGEVTFADIGSNECWTEEKNKVTAEMDQFFYNSEGKERYMSPVDFIDGKGAVTMTYTKNFPLVFGDYNHDGNPDYAIRIASDAKGSTYDVRCLDINGTPWEANSEIYLYNEFSDSVRLQLSNQGKILTTYLDPQGKWQYKEEKLFKDRSNCVHEEVTDIPLDDYRMYSQRYYLPETLRSYDQKDKQVICYFWNNTSSKVKLGTTYEIERREGDTWKCVSKGKRMKPMEVEGRSCIELTFDISDITAPSQEKEALYRIKTYAGQQAVYGGFYKTYY